MAKITANNIQAGSITVDSLSAALVSNLTSVSTTSIKAQDAFDRANSANVLAQSAFDAANTVSPLDSFSRQTANAAFVQANTGTALAQAAFNAANTVSRFINLNMPGTLNVPFTGTSRYYPTQAITLGTVYANLSASPSANLQFVILKNGANIGNSFIITTSSAVMTPVVTSGVSLTTSDYLTLNLLGSDITAADLWVRISYSQ